MEIEVKVISVRRGPLERMYLLTQYVILKCSTTELSRRLEVFQDIWHGELIVVSASEIVNGAELRLSALDIVGVAYQLVDESVV